MYKHPRFLGKTLKVCDPSLPKGIETRREKKKNQKLVVCGYFFKSCLTTNLLILGRPTSWFILFIFNAWSWQAYHFEANPWRVIQIDTYMCFQTWMDAVIRMYWIEIGAGQWLVRSTNLSVSTVGLKCSWIEIQPCAEGQP